jgi:alpha-amylase
MSLVYGKDYYGEDVWPGAYGLKKWIDNLCWISRKLAFGAMNIPYGDEKVIVLQRNGQGGSLGTSPGLLTAINFDTWSSKQVTVPTVFWPGTHLHDFTGRHHDIWCDGEGRATFTIPSNAYGHGQSYLCFSWAGMEGSPIEIHTRETTQVIFGAEDLDVPPAKQEAAPVMGSVFAQKGTRIFLSLELPKEVKAEKVLVMVNEPDNSQSSDVLGDGGHAAFTVKDTGEHWISVTAMGTVDVPYELTLTYTAPRGLTA